MPVLLALLGAVAYGISDFLAALGARRLGVVAATVLGYGAGLVAIVALWPLAPGAWSAGAALAGAAAGVLAAVGFLGFYAALAIGPMSVLSPLMAVVGSLVPVAIALVGGERMSPLAVAAVVAAITAGALVSANREPANRVTARALLLALVGGVGLGSSIAAIDSAPEGSGLIPGVLELAVGLVVLGIIAASRWSRSARRSRSRLETTRGRARWSRSARRSRSRLETTRGRIEPAVVSGRGVAAPGRSSTDPAKPGRAGYAQALGGGSLLGLANGLLVLALVAGGGLAVVAVLINLYPVVTVILATVITRERIAPVQIAGVALALAASVVLTFA
ncbi:EamA family transporter [Galbitalea sp. SE-J8]|uniref:EamA family transporter n=1 Tax=Galbitalea sp. SE-J8 TaxID=3054952 RepID=UPI00259CF489|nr:EamA family transporter [Galbitalea sp. SE-J8]MDM4761774.1 EamA family transporter [Galbitalea sp. SE-J8]